jgi:hypothetical protein
MKKNTFYLAGVFTMMLTALVILISSCQKDAETPPPAGPTPTTPSLSLIENFDDASALVGQGWVIRNNTDPVGQTGWRQGRYEALSQPSKKPNLPAFVGFQAYNSTNTPNDFISCDVTCVNTAGDISAWLITPPLTIKNGDSLTFYTRTQDDSQFPIFTKDRLQVRLNKTDGSANVGSTPSSVGNFTTLLLDTNPAYIENDNGGHPYLDWTLQKIKFTGLAAPITNARIAFRYYGISAGINGGTSGANYASIVGIDNVVFGSK